ncbi:MULTISPECIES: hypothetical protein [Spirulina sp. CCY15215]|uniref:hypothetical protein n=1 Tax=Spirulina sp. CCY15215 TaxID=2767591 RepID=UPI00194DF4A4|nr:hypothetical protein [Spirulina major]
MASPPVQFEQDSPFPLLESALLNLLQRKERTWGYFQVKEQNNDHFLCIPSLPRLRISKSEKNYGYRAYWVNKKEPSITVQRKEKMILDIKKKREKKQKTYEILQYFDERENLQQQRVNGILANLIKVEIENNLPPAGVHEFQPIVVILRRDRSL